MSYSVISRVVHSSERVLSSTNGANTLTFTSMVGVHLVGQETNFFKPLIKLCNYKNRP